MDIIWAILRGVFVLGFLLAVIIALAVLVMLVFGIAAGVDHRIQK